MVGACPRSGCDYDYVPPATNRLALAAGYAKTDAPFMTWRSMWSQIGRHDFAWNMKLRVHDGPEDEGCRAEILRRAREMMKADPDRDFISISLDDNDEICQCPKCAKLAADEGVVALALEPVNFSPRARGTPTRTATDSSRSGSTARAERVRRR